MTIQKVVVCDNGTGYIKAGFAGENLPSAVFPCMVGRAAMRSTESAIDKRLSSSASALLGLNENTKSLYVGQEAADKRAILDIAHPIENGVIKNWQDMERIWEYAFAERLGVGESERRNGRILLTEAPQNPVKNRERMAEVMFERFGWGSLYVSVQAVLTLYAQGLQTGIVVDSGDGVTHIVPIFEGFEMPHLVRRLDIAGSDITRQLQMLLHSRGYSFNSTADFDIVREVKERLCFVA